MLNLIAPLFALLLLVAAPAAFADLEINSCNYTDGNYTINSPYRKNLDSLFTKTATTSLENGFYNFTTGHSPNTVSLISLCFGNINITACHKCQKLATNAMKKSCPTQKTAITWSDNCMLRYSKSSVVGLLTEDPAYVVLNVAKVSNDAVEKYSGAVMALLEGLPGNASAGDDRIKFAAAQSEFNSSVKLYAMAQCTPDLSREECSKCVDDASNFVQTCNGCKGARGGRALLPSCIVRFEEYKFYLSGSDAPVSSPSFAPVPSETTSPEEGPSLSPSLAPDVNVSPSSNLQPDSSPSPSTNPNHDDTVNTKVGSPSPSSIGNAATNDIIGSTSLIWAIVVFIACLL